MEAPAHTYWRHIAVYTLVAAVIVGATTIYASTVTVAKNILQAEQASITYVYFENAPLETCSNTPQNPDTQLSTYTGPSGTNTFIIFLSSNQCMWSPVYNSNKPLTLSQCLVQVYVAGLFAVSSVTFTLSIVSPSGVQNLGSTSVAVQTGENNITIPCSGTIQSGSQLELSITLNGIYLALQYGGAYPTNLQVSQVEV